MDTMTTMNKKSLTPSGEHIYYDYITEDKKPLHFQIQGKEVTIYGGSCHHPLIEDANLYVSLDGKQPVFEWEQPWAKEENKQHIRFPIQDMFIPDKTEDFKSCIKYIQSSLIRGNKVHVGCIAGNGRTGMVLSALIQASMGENIFDKNGNKISAIDYVRENYSAHAVETVPQILYLHYNFGVKLPKGSQKDVLNFLDFFEQKVGTSLENILLKGTDFDKVFNVLNEVNHSMFSKITLSNFLQNNPSHLKLKP